jgi:spermidine export protein MdtJ
MDWTAWVLLVVAAALEFAGDLLLKWWADSDNWLGFGAGLSTYAVSLIIFAVLLRRADLSIIFALWVGAAAVLAALAGCFLFGEVFTLQRMLGVLLIVAGVVLLGVGKPHP